MTGEVFVEISLLLFVSRS